MTMCSAPEEIGVRRCIVKEMYEKGYSILDIARFFELPYTYIIRSLNKVGYNIDHVDTSNLNKRKKAVNINRAIRERNSNLEGKSLSEVQKLGFWKIPTEYEAALQTAGKNNKTLAVQIELRKIGFEKREILSYLGIDKVSYSVRRSQTDPFFDNQIEVCKQLLKEGWSYSYLFEFCGVSVSRLVNRDKVRKENPTKRKRKNTYLTQMENIYNMYKNNENMTHRKIAEHFGISRKTVIHYINLYKELHPELDPIPKRMSVGSVRKIV